MRCVFPPSSHLCLAAEYHEQETLVSDSGRWHCSTKEVFLWNGATLMRTQPEGLIWGPEFAVTDFVRWSHQIDALMRQHFSGRKSFKTTGRFSESEEGDWTHCHVLELLHRMSLALCAGRPGARGLFVPSLAEPLFYLYLLLTPSVSLYTVYSSCSG